MVSNVRHVTKPDSSYNIQLEHPPLVIDAIRKVVEAAHRSSPLAH
jgi:hypothetical protein